MSIRHLRTISEDAPQPSTLANVAELRDEYLAGVHGAPQFYPSGSPITVLWRDGSQTTMPLRSIMRDCGESGFLDARHNRTNPTTGWRRFWMEGIRNNLAGLVTVLAWTVTSSWIINRVIAVPNMRLDFPSTYSADPSVMYSIIKQAGGMAADLEKADLQLAMYQGKKKRLNIHTVIDIEGPIEIGQNGPTTRISGKVRFIQPFPSAAAENLLSPPHKSKGRTTTPAKAIPSTQDIGRYLGDPTDPPFTVQGAYVKIGGGHVDVIEKAK